MSSRADNVYELFSGMALRRADQNETGEATAPAWSFAQLAGRLVEISGVGAVAPLTSAVGLVLEAQLNREPAAWITLPTSSFYPPDVAESGVDLDTLVVVRVGTSLDAGRVADRLVRSGAFGIVVLDLGKEARIPTALQGRLVSLAKRHNTAIVCLTVKSSDTASLGSMVSLRAEAMRDKLSGGYFRCKVRVLKDKNRGPNWSHSEVIRGPAGLR